MKSAILKAATVLAALTALISSCSKDSSKNVTGSYSYKISGTVTLMASQLVGLDEATLAAYKASGVDVDPKVVGLFPEQGQMHIIDDGDKVIVTFNDLLGNADVTSATIEGNKITLVGTDIKAAQLTDGTLKIGSGLVQFGGSGKKNDDMLIIDMVYNGSFTISGTPMTVVASSVKCVAQHN